MLDKRKGPVVLILALVVINPVGRSKNSTEHNMFCNIIHRHRYILSINDCLELKIMHAANIKYILWLRIFVHFIKTPNPGLLLYIYTYNA